MTPCKSELEKRNMTRLSNKAAGHLTRECLQTALIRLLSEKDMDKISITELVKVAGVSRTAFYSNYEKKEDVLLEWVDAFVSELTELMFSAIRKNRLQRMYGRIFEYILINEKTFTLLMKGNLKNHLSESINDYMMKRYENLDMQGRLLLSGWCGMMTNILVFWYQNGMSEGAEKMTDLCWEMTEAFLRKMLQVCPEFLEEEAGCPEA